MCWAACISHMIYWAGGTVDAPDTWPRSVTLPENVHVFPVGRVETFDLARAGEVIAKVQGTSCREDGEVDARGFHRDVHGLFTIGVAHGTSDSAGHEGDRVQYMALGGRHQQQTVDMEPGVVLVPNVMQRSGEDAIPREEFDRIIRICRECGKALGEA